MCQTITECGKNGLFLFLFKNIAKNFRECKLQRYLFIWTTSTTSSTVVFGEQRVALGRTDSSRVTEMGDLRDEAISRKQEWGSSPA